MKNTKCRSFHCFITGILLLLAFVHSDMKAQCPTNIVPDSVAWTSTSVPFSVGSCTGTIIYCTRTIQAGDSVFDTISMTMGYQEKTIIENYLDTVKLADTSCLSTLTNDYIIKYAANYLFTNIVAQSPCDTSLPHFADSTYRGRVYRANCWRMLGSPDYIYYAPCGDGSSHCVFECPICPAPFPCLYWVEGDDPLCHPLPGSGTWNFGTCYNIGCDIPH